ncbi:MAG: glycosyltransferase family 2 protein [Methanomassiliicoccales archaeon]|nr:glycosyltransferase family 2 protein [Methanomassiliicoccales archaeon]
MDISVIIPTMNEEESIGQVIDSVHQALNGFEHEVLVVDTNSKDRTREIAVEKGAVVIEEPRRGYGRAYKTGFERAGGKVIATLDADCTYPAEDIPQLYKMLIDQDLEFITTNRFAKLEKGAMSSKHRLGNFALTFTLNLFFGVRIKDSQSGMWVFRRDILDRLLLSDDGMPMSEEIKIEAFRKVRSQEAPIIYRRRVGEVKLSSWKDGWKNMKFLFKKRFRSSHK